MHHQGRQILRLVGPYSIRPSPLGIPHDKNRGSHAERAVTICSLGGDDASQRTLYEHHPGLTRLEH
jgi:hypothetical protein